MKLSAGILLFRSHRNTTEVLIGHMGGPFWSKKDHAAWSMPKGEVEGNEDPLATALREFTEELGHKVPDGPRLDLGTFEQSRQKSVRIWAVEGDLDPATCISNTFEIEWPRGSGRLQTFPEIDRAAWFDTDTAMSKVIAGQRQVIERLVGLVDG
jgi:predicted NUDIX family NTP pyrophosphohydrolase